MSPDEICSGRSELERGEEAGGEADDDATQEETDGTW